MTIWSNCRILAAVTSFTLLSGHVAPAALRTWTGLGSDGLWTTAANWSASTLPMVSDDVLFLNGAVKQL